MDLVSRRSNVHKQVGTKAGFVVTWPNINTSLQTRTYDTEDVLELLNSNDDDSGSSSWNRKQRDLEEAEEPVPEPKEGNMAILRKTEGFGLAEAGLQANKCFVY